MLTGLCGERMRWIPFKVGLLADRAPVMTQFPCDPAHRPARLD